MKILDQEQEIWLKDIKSIIQDTEKLLISINASETDLNALKTSSSQIDDLFLLVVVGEFNSGKSALINALLGEKILEEGVTPTTTQVNLLRFGSSLERKTLDENLYIIQAPIEFLTDISIVDTPGTNAIIRQHETITKEFIPRSDFVLFVTSADRPFTDSENNFLKIIKEWGKKIIVVVNKIDILESESDIERIKDFISDNIVSMLEISPEIFPISTRLAISGKNGNSEHWELSRFESVENYIAEQLDNKTKVKLKLLNPLGIIQNLINKHNVILNNRLDILKDDIDLINNIQKQIEIY